MSEDKDKAPERVWITWDDAYPWPTPEAGGDEYIRADLVATKVREDDNKVIHELFSEWCGEGTIGILKHKLAEYIATVRREARDEAFKEAADLIPSNWLDSLLSGPEKVVGKHPYGGLDIERLLNALRERIRGAGSGIISRDNENEQSTITK